MGRDGDDVPLLAHNSPSLGSDVGDAAAGCNDLGLGSVSCPYLECNKGGSWKLLP